MLLSFLALCGFLRLVVCVFFHDPSAVLLKPERAVDNSSDFGFSMRYQPGTPPRLIVGAPSSSLMGEVYNCPILDNTNINCSYVDIDTKRVVRNYSRYISDDQKFYLGSSFAITSDYILTCAPLWISTMIHSKIIKQKRKTTDAYGDCFFVYRNGTTREFTGFARVDAKTRDGGTGWNTLADDINGYILIAKTSPIKTDIKYYRSTDDPNKRPESLWRQSKYELFLGGLRNTGFGLASGTFFSNETIYAVSSITSTTSGLVIFLKPDGNKLSILQKPQTNHDANLDRQYLNPYQITSEVVGAAFGYSLCAADLNLDGLSELIVGAPMQAGDEESFENGAVYVYEGCKIETCNENRMRIIRGNKEGGRFGTAIAASDIDGDNIPEIFISAPYADSGVGAVYILSGFELNKKLVSHSSSNPIQLSDLKHTQIIQRKSLRHFGFSLEVVNDADDNGCSELAVGVPGSASVLLFRGIPTVNVTISSRLLGSQIVREQDNNFTVNVCLHISYPSALTNITGNISVTNDIYENREHFHAVKFEVDLSKKPEFYCENVTVDLDHHEPAEYQFNTRLELLGLHEKLTAKDFNKTWVMLSLYSEADKRISILRHCTGDDCKPELSVKIGWSGLNNDTYIVGSSQKEKVSIVVSNNGHSAYDACLRVYLRGANVSEVDCTDAPHGYECLLPKPLKQFDHHNVDVILNMMNITNLDKELFVSVRLYENCNQKYNSEEHLNVGYNFDAEIEKVTLEGTSHGFDVTDQQILDDRIKYFKDDHEYTILNNGVATWKNITTEIYIEKRPFIKQVETTENNDCETSKMDNEYLIKCNLTLPPGSVRKVVAHFEISKDVDKYLSDGVSNTSSTMLLFLQPAEKKVKKSILTTITFKKDLSFGNNNLVILISCVLALFLLAVIIYVLYRNDFFKRKQKKRLDEFKESIRRRSVRLASESTRSRKESSAEDEHGHVDIEVVEENVFEDIPCEMSTNDDALLVNETCPVGERDRKSSLKV